MSFFKDILLKNFPSQLYNKLSLIKLIPLAARAPDVTKNYAYDLRRFLTWSSENYNNFKTQTNLQSLITATYHRIEKGLSLKNPRVGFGQDVIELLVSKLNNYLDCYDCDETVLNSINVLFVYYHFNLEKGLNNEKLYKQLISLKERTYSKKQKITSSGFLNVTKKEIHKLAKLNLEGFFSSRYSVRNFTRDEVDISFVQIAVKMAQKTPSVCNRQSSKVYVFSAPEDKVKVLSYQRGNRGFGDQASKILVVTSNLEHFHSTRERYQCWIDGGMFSMSIVYALHSLGLGTCCLNWSVTFSEDQALKRAIEIPDSESIIMMIAVGHLPDEFKVAKSPRKNIDEVMVVR